MGVLIWLMLCSGCLITCFTIEVLSLKLRTSVCFYFLCCNMWWVSILAKNFSMKESTPCLRMYSSLSRGTLAMNSILRSCSVFMCAKAVALYATSSEHLISSLWNWVCCSSLNVQVNKFTLCEICTIRFENLQVMSFFDTCCSLLLNDSGVMCQILPILLTQSLKFSLQPLISLFHTK